MQATFVELPAFERVRYLYLDDDADRQLQPSLLANPEAGTWIERTGKTRKAKSHDEETRYFWRAARGL